MTLHERLATEVDAWRAAQYATAEFPAIAEILEFAVGSDESGTNVRFLRTPQLRALETYWYLRLVAGTPHVADLYRKLYADPPELMKALGLTHGDLMALALKYGGVDGLLKRIQEDRGASASRRVLRRGPSHLRPVDGCGPQEGAEDR